MIETRKSFRNEPDPLKWTFYDRLMSSKMSKAIKMVGDAYEKMLFREVVKEGFYELQVSERDVNPCCVLLCVAVCCCVLLCVAVVLLCVTVCCCVLLCVAVVLLLCCCCFTVVLLLCCCV